MKSRIEKYGVFLLLFLSSQQLPRDILVDVSFLRDNTVVLSRMVIERFCVQDVPTYPSNVL